MMMSEAMDESETAQDLSAYRAAKASDDGTRVALEELQSDLPTASVADCQK
jgi:hypothetical protein